MKGEPEHDFYREARIEAETAKRTGLKYYGLESRVTGHRYSDEWRYYSLYNGARGAWHWSQELAIEDGEAHKALVILSLRIID